MDQSRNENMQKFAVVEEVMISNENRTLIQEFGFFFYKVDSAILDDMFQRVRSYFAYEEKAYILSNTKQSQWETYRTGPKIGYSKQKHKESYSYSSGYGNLFYDSYCSYMSQVSHNLLKNLDSSLLFTEYLETLSLLHYFPNQESETALKEHKDWGLLTLLATDSVGLEAYYQGEWISIPPKKDHIIVNLGNAFAFLNPDFHSPLHRVRFQKEKFSIVFFLEPKPSQILKNNLSYYDFILQNT